MKKTVLERITDLQGMIDRRENPVKVKEEVHAIFEMISQEQDKNVKDKALDAMFKLAFHMVEELDESPLSRLMSALEGMNKKAKIVPVEVNVHEYLDAIVIETDKRLPYSKLMHVIERAVPQFEERISDLFSAELNREEKRVEIDYIDEKHKSIILDLSKWELSEEGLTLYVEGLVEYIQK